MYRQCLYHKARFYYISSQVRLDNIEESNGFEGSREEIARVKDVLVK